MSENFIIDGTVFNGLDNSEKNSLESLTIPDGVTEIGDYALCGFGNLSSILIPNSVKIIRDGAFREC